MEKSSREVCEGLGAELIEDLRFAASKMSGEKRRAFVARMTLKHCAGNARQAERVFGWGREMVETGLGELRTGLVCYGAQSSSGRKRWEDEHPEAAAVLVELAEEQGQQDPTFRTALAYTRLTAEGALAALSERGFEHELPVASTMAEVLNRLGYRLRKVLKAKPQKKIEQTDAIFENIEKKDGRAIESGTVARLSVDCKATVGIGDLSRGGRTRGENKACDHDMGVKEKYVPFGIVDEDTGQLRIRFAGSHKTSDFIVDGLQRWWETLEPAQRQSIERVQIKMDNGSESSGVRTRFLERIVQFTDHIGKEIQLLYYPPYHSKYNPIERCWGILEQHWNGTRLDTVDTMFHWARTMTWKGLHPVVELTNQVYEKGIKLSKAAMRVVEQRLERNPLLPKWDIRICPKSLPDTG